MAAGLAPMHRTGVFFKALANFQWDRLLGTDIISEEYLEGCYQLGQQYRYLCSSIVLICERHMDDLPARIAGSQQKQRHFLTFGAAIRCANPARLH